MYVNGKVQLKLCQYEMKHNVVRVYGREGVQLHTFLATALCECVCVQLHAIGHFTPHNPLDKLCGLYSWSGESECFH